MVILVIIVGVTSVNMYDNIGRLFVTELGNNSDDSGVSSQWTVDISDGYKSDDIFEFSECHA